LSRELLARNAETRFAFDEAGRMLRDTSPDAAAAPRMRIAGCATENLVHWRADVPGDVADELARLAATEPPLYEPGAEPVHLDRYYELLGGRATFEVCFVFGDATPPRVDAGIVAELASELELPAHFRSIGFSTVAKLWSPWTVALAGGEIASVVETVRVGPRGVECGVNTDPRFRGRGLATAAVAAWSRLPGVATCARFYSTDPTNTSSRAVAARLGLEYMGAGCSIT
jgi:hypothetical protein